jgi:hypothetical protein
VESFFIVTDKEQSDLMKMILAEVDLNDMSYDHVNASKIVNALRSVSCLFVCGVVVVMEFVF